MLWRVYSITMHGPLHKQTHRYCRSLQASDFAHVRFPFFLRLTLNSTCTQRPPTRKLFHFFPTFPTFFEPASTRADTNCTQSFENSRTSRRNSRAREKRPNGKASAKRRLNWHTYSGKCKDIGAYAVNFPLGPSFPGKTREGNVPFRARLIMQTLFVQIIQIASLPHHRPLVPLVLWVR